MAYSYTLGLSLVNPCTEIDLTAYQEEMKQAVVRYNAKQEKAVNHKTLALLQITPRELVVALDSQTTLATPAKALRTFSQIIVDEFPDIASQVLYHNHIFRSFPIVDDSQIEQADIKYATVEISDQAALEGMVRLCMKPPEDRTLQEKQILSKIKHLLQQTKLL